MKITPENRVSLSQALEGDANIERPIEEFPFYFNRLLDIDYEKIISEGKLWKDPNFQANKNAILDATMTRQPQHIQKWDSYVWKRPSEVYGDGNFKVFSGITPSDIKQGECGDCYFLSSISSLAEFPERVENLFITKDANTAGCYALRFFINGEKKVVVVDDQFPWCNHKQAWAFSRSTAENEIWVLLLEKAWAKIFGSYMRIEGGTTGEALPSITGAPATAFIHSEVTDKEAFWKKVYEADKKNYVIATAVSSGKSNKTTGQVEKTGLLDSHAYSLIKALEITVNLKTVRLLQIRNPWAQKEWQGDWSDRSPKWTEALRKEVGAEQKDDGVFFISFEDYIQFFYVTTICKYVNGGKRSIVIDQHKNQDYGIVKFSVPANQTGAVVIVLNQVHHRFVDETMRGSYQYAPLKLILAKVVKDKLINPKSVTPETESFSFIEGDYVQQSHLDIELPSLSAGDYVLLFQAEWTRLTPLKKLTLSMYAPDLIEMQRVAHSNFPNAILSEMDNALNYRLSIAERYQLPSYALQ